MDSPKRKRSPGREPVEAAGQLGLTPEGLTRLRRRLLRERRHLAEGLGLLQHSSGDFAGEGDDPVDLAGVAIDQETSWIAGTSMTRALVDVEEALERIADGTYGFCRDCGDRIPWERLEAIPSAQLCLGCKRKEEGEEARHGETATAWELADQYSHLRDEYVAADKPYVQRAVRPGAFSRDHGFRDGASRPNVA
jgi:RNA polymerase-binding transcription factor DksA